jgi:hypothetical protein
VIFITPEYVPSATRPAADVGGVSEAISLGGGRDN